MDRLYRKIDFRCLSRMSYDLHEQHRCHKKTRRLRRDHAFYGETHRLRLDTENKKIMTSGPMATPR